jgi:hypothetical protein
MLNLFLYPPAEQLHEPAVPRTQQFPCPVKKKGVGGTRALAHLLVDNHHSISQLD